MQFLSLSKIFVNLVILLALIEASGFNMRIYLVFATLAAIFTAFPNPIFFLFVIILIFLIFIYFF
jgi:hypothetical protein